MQRILQNIFHKWHSHNLIPCFLAPHLVLFPSQPVSREPKSEFRMTTQSSKKKICFVYRVNFQRRKQFQQHYLPDEAIMEARD